jgi:dTDP-4-amino-4,6-dideoxygalactose transaminase
MANQGIEASFHFPPLHESPFARAQGYRATDCADARQFSERLIRVPVHQALSDADIRYIAATLRRESDALS